MPANYKAFHGSIQKSLAIRAISTAFGRAVKGMTQLRFLIVADALGAGLQVTTTTELHQKIELLTFLCKFATGHAVLPYKFVKAISDVSMYLNLPLPHWIAHTTAARIIDSDDGSNHIAYAALLAALATIIHRVTESVLGDPLPPPPSICANGAVTDRVPCECGRLKQRLQS